MDILVCGRQEKKGGDKSVGRVQSLHTISGCNIKVLVLQEYLDEPVESFALDIARRAQGQRCRRRGGHRRRGGGRVGDLRANSCGVRATHLELLISQYCTGSVGMKSQLPAWKGRNEASATDGGEQNINAFPPMR